jgi:omega-amidase
MPDLKITFFQASLEWENISGNLARFSKKLEGVREETDLIVLPEMFNTGFSMRAAALAEPMEGYSMAWMAEWAKKKDCPLAGSLIIEERKQYFNRFIWMSPDGSFVYYDKRHLFRMAGEDRYFSAGNQRLVVEHRGWRFCPLVCYDLRFPVWSRNKNDYDVLIFVANWPESRRTAWKVLLQARAVENQAYVIGVNRVGEDGSGNSYAGDSAVYSPAGELISRTAPFEEKAETVTLSRIELDTLREKFAVKLDADRFEILPDEP